MGKIVIIDYGTSNLTSLLNALKYLGCKAYITNDKNSIKNAEKIIIPGVGSFNYAMKNIIKTGLVHTIKEVAINRTPLLGICLGMQILFSVGYENSINEGLNLIEGKVIRLPGKVKLPHMGWNNLKITNGCPILKNITKDEYFYFVHSYIVKPENSNEVASLTDYGSDFCSVIAKDNIFGVQFHPEKSHNSGLKVLSNFINL